MDQILYPMRTFIENHKLSIWMFLLILVGGFFRFYKLDWGQGLFSHPDEYHIIGSVNQLSFPTQMHPHFFSYGTVTIYLIYFTQEFLKYLSTTFNFQLSILNSFIIGRFYSALFSTLSIIIVYKICRSFMERHFSYLAALCIGLTPGLIQQAHFATPESAQIFFLLSCLLFMIKLIKQNKILFLILASVFLGFAMGVKVSSIVFLLPLTITAIIKSYPKTLSFKTPILFTKQVLKRLLKFTGLMAMTIIITTVTFALVAPYVFLDFPAFRGNLEYEGGLAVGKFPVFYTRQFIDTLPVLFQMEKVLPYVLGPVLLIFGTLGFFIVMLNLLASLTRLASRAKRELWRSGFQHLGLWAKIPKQSMKQVQDMARNDREETVLILVSFLSLFLTNAFLFAKWTRFIAPTFPFFAIFAAISLKTFAEKTQRPVYYFLAGVLVFGTVLWTMSFFSIYTNPDIRITASKWLVSNAPSQSVIVIEGGNMIDIPLAGNFQRIGFDFYNLEEDAQTRYKIAAGLEEADYFLVQSRRVFLNHQRLRNQFSKTARFYDTLFAGKMGFEQIKEFHQYPMLKLGNFKLEFPDETAEETWSVFDHPVIRIFEKKVQLTKDDYDKFLEL